MRTSVLRLFFASVLMLIASAIPALAIEQILDFSSDIAVARDGGMTVRETITVHAEGRRIEHGIFRDFPTTYPKDGKFFHVRFAVDSVTRDGQREPYEIESLDNGKRVRIGNADVFIPEGDHTYVLTYRTDRQIAFLPDTDQLYWNVTGNAWAFPIRHAEAIVHLPEGAKFGSFNVYTGPQGSRGGRGSGENRGASMRFFTTAPLGKREGLTFALNFSKGVVQPPTAMQKALYFIRDNVSMVAAVGGFAAVGIYFFAAWLRFGRDPVRGTIIPLFAPPRNLSAASIRFIRKMDYDRKCFAAALVGMAVKGYLKIAEEGRVYTLTRLVGHNVPLAPAETAVAHSLFSGDNSIVLKKENHEQIAGAIKGLQTALAKEDEGRYFVSNRAWYLGGIAILIASVAVTGIFAESPNAPTVTMLWFASFIVGIGVVYRVANTDVRSLLLGLAPRVAIILILFSAMLLVTASTFDVNALIGDVPVASLVALLGQAVLAVAFYHLLKAPTVEGQKIRDEIEGFRLFLDVAEKDRLEVLHPPTVTPEIFEQYLPYAIALDAENAWSKKFEADAAKAGRPIDGGAYMPGWYYGSSFNSLGSTGFASAIGGSIASATAAASVAPGGGLGGGGGGGGSSGGGGGGGGGGGW